MDFSAQEGPPNAPASAAARKDFGPRPPALRSRASNRPLDLVGGDKRSAAARRFRDLCADLASDAGGIELMSTVRQQLVRRFAGASVLLERLDEQIAQGRAVDVAEYSTLVSTIVRLAQRLGLNRRARRVETLDDILREMSNDASDEAESS